MKLFQRIFATFCAVIVCAIFVASFSFWLVQNTLAENQFNQRRTIETTLMNSILSAFRARGDSGAREILAEWEDSPVSNSVYVILGDEKKDILDRNIDNHTIDAPACLPSIIPIPIWRTSNTTVSAKNTSSLSKVGTAIRRNACPARSLSRACHSPRFGTNSSSCPSSSSSVC